MTTGEPTATCPRRVRVGLSLVGLALLFTVLDAIKPLQVDDAAYYYYAAHIAQAPLDPYGFTIFWYQWPHHANQVLCPPVLPYWLAPAIRFGGERPFLWKLWLFPFALLFVCSLYFLFRRFARGLEMPLLWMTVLSPTFLPSFNLMLDIPALALSLGSVVLFLRACDKECWGLAALAGLVAGLAMETKYTGFLAVAPMFLYGGLMSIKPGTSPRTGAKRFGFWLTAVVVAAGLFGSWEALMARLYADQGGSHFLFHLHETQQENQQVGLSIRLLRLAIPLFTLLGGVAPVGAVLGLAALRKRWEIVSTAGALVALGYLILAGCSGNLNLQLTLDPRVFGPGQSVTYPWGLAEALFTGFGVVVCSVAALISWRLVRVRRGGLWRPVFWQRYRMGWFLILWLLVEVAGYFLLTPFLAVRRVMGVVVVCTLLIGRLASRSCRSPRRQVLVWAIAVGNIVLGLGFYGVDLREAWARKEAPSVAAEHIRIRDSQAKIWFTGHWGFQYYAERLGMIPLIPDESRLSPGDWLVVPDWRITHQGIDLDAQQLEWVETVGPEDPIPWETVWPFYGTSTGAPLDHHEGPRVRLFIYRVSRAFIPRSSF